MVAQESRIITPYDEDRIFVFNKDKIPVHVMEVPACRFKDLPLCLATANPAELEKLKFACNEFHKWYEYVAVTLGGLKP